MRRINCFLYLLIMCFYFIPSAASAMDVKFFLGKVTLLRGGKDMPVQIGEVVGNGDVIKTGKGAIVELTFDENSTITVQENSVIQVGSRNMKDASGISIVSGEVKGKFGKLKKGEYRIGSPTTVCGVRGTEFDVAVSRGGDTYVVLNEGTLSVRNPYGSSDIKGGTSLEADVAMQPVSGRIKVKSSDWETARNENIEGSLDVRAENYSRYMDKFGDDAAADSKAIESLREETVKTRTKDELARSGEKIAGADSGLEDSMMMNEASIANINSLAEEFEGSGYAAEFRKAAEKGNAVMEQQVKNRAAIEKVKADYRDAYDRIMKKYRDDKSGIFRNLDDFKKTLPVSK